MTHSIDDNDDDGPDGAAAAACVTTESESRKGAFNFPDNATDLIGMMLDPDIRWARNKVHRQIENGHVGRAGGVGNGGGRVTGQALTPAAQTIAKAVTDIHAIQKQAERNRQHR